MVKKNRSNEIKLSRTWLEIDCGAIRENLNTIAKRVEPAKVMVVLKANAYGLGLRELARVSAQSGAARFGLAGVREALEILDIGLPCQVLGSLLPEEVSPAVSNNIVCPIDSFDVAMKLSEEASRQKKHVRVHFLVDTGMGMLGIPHFCAEETIRKCVRLPGLEVEGIYSHFANANNPADGKTIEQMDLFQKVLKSLNGIDFPIVHLANSDGINNFPEANYSLVRTGINLYGVFDLQGKKAYPLKKALSLCSCLISKRFLPKGTTIGYGGDFVLPSDTVVGTIPIGYADGIPFYLDKRAHVLLGEKAVPIIGRVSMDYITVDLTGAEETKVGDRVVVFGKSGEAEITVEDWARLKLSHPYDILTSLGNRVERVYLNN